MFESFVLNLILLILELVTKELNAKSTGRADLSSNNLAKYMHCRGLLLLRVATSFILKKYARVAMKKFASQLSWNRD